MNDYDNTSPGVLSEDWIDSLLVEDEENHIENFDDTINDTLKWHSKQLSTHPHLLTSNYGRNHVNTFGHLIIPTVVRMDHLNHSSKHSTMQGSTVVSN